MLERGPPSALTSWKVAVPSQHPAGPLQPHQGRNPCSERNNKSESSDELQPQGKNLLGKARVARSETLALLFIYTYLYIIIYMQLLFVMTYYSPSPPELSMGSRARILHNAESLLQSRAADERPTSAPVNRSQVPAGRTETKGTSKKVPNALAEHNRSGLFGLFRRSSSATSANSLLQYALPAQAAPFLPAATADKACNLRTAASLLPQMARREQAGREGNGDTQMTCLSPSPSTTRSPPIIQRAQGDQLV